MQRLKLLIEITVLIEISEILIRNSISKKLNFRAFAQIISNKIVSYIVLNLMSNVM